MKKEKFEWIHSWCDNTDKIDQPRILLVGDSITYNYQEMVRKALKGKCYVDYISTSYAIDSKMYMSLIVNFAKDSKYNLIHLNHGLHGIHMSKKTYRTKMEKLIDKLGSDAKITLANSTVVYLNGNKVIDKRWMKRVIERNQVIDEIASEKGFFVNDLHEISKMIKIKDRAPDGTHYSKAGYKVLALAVAEFILKNL